LGHPILNHGAHMKRSSQNEIMNSLRVITVFRGIYRRVAKQLDIDPSYVSRVARGERRAAFVTEALKKEIRQAMGRARRFQVVRVEGPGPAVRAKRDSDRRISVA
jgi:hypothetical protein